jgi:Ca2+-binding EF-hand superfamily protein
MKCAALALAFCALGAAVPETGQTNDNHPRKAALAESRKKWDELFPKIDTNKDNALSREEVTAYMQSGHHLLTKAGKAEAIKDIKAKTIGEFGKLDKNGDGFLDEAEMSASDDKAKRNLRRRGDNDGKKIDIDAYIVLKNPQFADDEATYVHFLALDLMDSFDSDTNGSLTFEEYDAMKKKERDALSKFTKTENEEGMITISFGGPGDEEIAKIKVKDDADFKESDADASGNLDQSEFEGYLKSKGEAKWNAEVEEFFVFSDQNKDGKLELDEVHHNVDFFAVGKILKHREALHSEL